MGLVTVARFTDPPSAHVNRALLEAHGIDAYLRNEHYVGMDWLHSQAVGGVELQVHREQAERARELLADPPAMPEFASGPDEAASLAACPACGARAVESDRLDHRVRAASLGLGIPAAIGAYRFRCAECGHRWRTVPAHRGLRARLADLASLLVGTLVAIALSPVWLVSTLLGTRARSSLECWACGLPFERTGEEGQLCEGCGVVHPPDIAFTRVIEIGRAYDAACDACHTPYVRADYTGNPSGWRCSICGTRLAPDGDRGAARA